MLHSIPGSRGEGSDPPWSPSEKIKVMTTQSPPNRSGCMLLVKTNNTTLLGYASYLRGTETAEVEGLWPCRGPKTCACTPRQQ